MGPYKTDSAEVWIERGSISWTTGAEESGGRVFFPVEGTFCGGESGHGEAGETTRMIENRDVPVGFITTISSPRNEKVFLNERLESPGMSSKSRRKRSLSLCQFEGYQQYI